MAHARRLGIGTVLTPIHTPQANGIAERLIGTLRRECVDHVIPFSASHLRHVLLEYVAYYNETRPHRTLELEPPDGTKKGRVPCGTRPLQRSGAVVTDGASRRSPHALTSELRKIWPELRRQGLVRRTKPLSARSVALLRLVCLDCSRGDRWETRWQAWELRYSDRWHYPSRRAFNSDFHRAERQLTGREKGLAPFYDERAWVAARPAGDVFALAKAGDTNARALLAESASQVAAALADVAERMHWVADNDEDTPQR